MASLKNSYISKKANVFPFLTKIFLFSFLIWTISLNYDKSCNNTYNNEKILSAETNRLLAEKCKAGPSNLKDVKQKKDKKTKNTVKTNKETLSNVAADEAIAEKLQEALYNDGKVDEQKLKDMENMFSSLTEKFNLGEELKKYEGDIEKMTEEMQKQKEKGGEVSMDMYKDLFESMTSSLIDSYAGDASDKKKMKMKKRAMKATGFLLKHYLKPGKIKPPKK
ncbi:hypothetical protein MKS88_003949 [Plasmodium brasilianum]|uniref:Uncharacterized protein n=2 Tax=Plasmodium (Plasmodium) TaxID=418103 RepID=A0A1D3SNA1_PLAMA|nr:Plasmodium exported protein, unknown function [Plasmodium malariae]KAI4837475.1 hypothetical protein MKS88_003949 [Plasmodium brasilianum]SCO93360.1 Plasmodium exported protein, unknown function [Plasmodium malariae]